MACSFMDPHGIVLLGVASDSMTVRSHEFWSMYTRGLTHATRNIRTQVKSTVHKGIASFPGPLRGRRKGLPREYLIPIPDYTPTQ